MTAVAEAANGANALTTIGYHASHEQFAPSELLDYARAAEAAGFAGIMSSDHFHPWSERQGQSGFSWSWLGAAMQATSLGFGVVTAPGWRYHPAIVAQAIATLCEMFPNRFWVALASGEALNERITGEPWPIKSERNARLAESVEIIRALWRGETVTHHGRVIVEEAKLYTRPRTAPPIIGPALSPETAEWMGGWADGLVTVNTKRERLREIVDAFRRGGGASKPIHLQVHLAYAATDDEARRDAHDQWRLGALSARLAADLRTPAHFDDAGSTVRPEDLEGHVRISSDPDRHIAWLREDLEMGFSHLYLHNVGRNQREFIEVFGERVVPALRAG